MNALAAVREVAQELEGAGVPSSRVDAEHLVANVLGLSRSGLYASDRELTEDEAQRIADALPEPAGLRYPEEMMRTIGR